MTQSATSAAGGPAFPAYPWSNLPPELADRLRPAVPDLAEVLIQEISGSVPIYQGRRSEAFWAGIREGVEQSLYAFLQLIGQARGPDEDLRAIVRALGRNEHRSGRTLDALQTAYRIGVRHAWRAFAAVAEEHGLDAHGIATFAESVYAFVDELAALSVAGYAESQADEASSRERARAALIDAVAGASPDRREARRLAAQTGWRVPSRLQALCAEPSAARALARGLGAEGVQAATEDVVVGLWPDPEGPGREARLMNALELRGTPVALGPSTSLEDAPASLAAARETLELGRRGVLGPPPWRWSDHLAAVGLARAAEPLGHLREQLLAPLRKEPEGSRRRLLETLSAVLDAGGNHGAAAEVLGVHVQTVRYRLGRLRDLLGAVIDDPATRFELQLALRAERLDGAG